MSARFSFFFEGLLTPRNASTSFSGLNFVLTTTLLPAALVFSLSPTVQKPSAQKSRSSQSADRQESTRSAALMMSVPFACRPGRLYHRKGYYQKPSYLPC
jgi:hypothetical protein